MSLSSTHQLQMVFGNHRIHIERGRKMPSDIPISEWKKLLAMLPEEIVQQTLNNTTNFYLSVEEDNRR